MRAVDKIKNFLFSDNRFADRVYNGIKLFVTAVVLTAILLPLYLIVAEWIRIEYDVRKCVDAGGDQEQCYQDYDVD